MTFSIPGEPVPKGRPRHGKGHTYTPKATKDAELVVWVYAMKSGIKVLHGPVQMTCRFFSSHPDKCDVDNCAKLVMDALNTTAYDDDKQVYSLHATKHFSDDPRTVVEIVELEG